MKSILRQISIIAVTAILFVCPFAAQEIFAEDVLTNDVVVEAANDSEFSLIASELTEEEINTTEKGTSDRLLIVSAGELDLQEIGGINNAVFNGEDLYVIQFNSSADAETAYEVMRTWDKVISVEFDQSVQVLEDEGTSGDGEDSVNDSDDTSGDGDDSSGDTKSTTNDGDDTIVTHKSWGVDYMGFDQLTAYLDPSDTSEVVIAVVDSGIDTTHEVFASKTVEGYDFLNNDSDPDDEDGHGTHVAGIVADCTKTVDRIKIMPLKVLNSKGEGTQSAVGNGILYAANNGAAVINISIGGEHSNYLEYIVEKASSLGPIIVAASGNDSVDIDTEEICPAHIKSVIAVGAISLSEQVPSYSNYGKSLDVVAPGVAIVSAYPVNTYKTIGGTSMAAPHVSSCAAIMYCRYGDLSIAKMTSLIYRMCTPKADTKKFGRGIVDMHNLIASIPDLTVSLNSAGYVYAKGGVKASPAVTQNGEALFKGQDYTLTYSNNYNVGLAKVTINGLGTYSGSVTKTFKIVPKGTSIKKLSRKYRGFTVSWKKQAAKMSKSRITGYQIQYSLSKQFKKNNKTVTVKGYKKTYKKISKLKSRRTYYVRIRTYKTVNGKKYYSAWSKAKSIKTK